MNRDYFLFSQGRQVNIPNDGDIFILPKTNMNYHSSNGILFEETLIKWCEQFGSILSTPGIFLDIGAHTGTYAVSLAKHFSKVHAFEPQRNTFYALCGSVALSNLSSRIICHNIGLGNVNQIGKQTLNIVSPDGGGSTLHNTNKNRILSTETVEIQTLDSLNLNNIAFIKIDVEDNELAVLEGARETLIRSSYPKIIYEDNSRNIDNPPAHYLKGLGYKVIQIHGYSNMFLAERKN